MSIVIRLAKYAICAWRFETACEGGDQGIWKQERTAFPIGSSER